MVYGVNAELLVELSLLFLRGQSGPSHLHGFLQNSRRSSGNPSGTWGSLRFGYGVKKLTGVGATLSAAGGCLLSLSFS